MNTDFIYSPDYKSLTRLTQRPVLYRNSFPYKAKALTTLRTIARATELSFTSDICRGKLLFRLREFSNGCNSVGNNLQTAFLGFHQDDALSTPVYLLIFSDLSCLLAIQDHEISKRGGTDWIKILPFVLQIPRKVKTRLDAEMFEFFGPTRNSPELHLWSLRPNGRKKKKGILNNESSCWKAEIPEFQRDALFRALEAASMEWAKAFPHMPMVHRPKPGEPRSGILGKDSQSNFEELIGQPYAWPSAFEWSNTATYPKAQTEEALRRAAVFLISRNEKTLSRLAIAIQAGVVKEGRKTRSDVNIFFDCLQRPENPFEFRKSLEDKISEMVRSEDFPIRIDDFVGTDLLIYGRDDDKFLRSRPQRIAFCSIEPQEISAHEKMDAIIHYGNLHD